MNESNLRIEGKLIRVKPDKGESYFLRTLSKTGHTRSLSLGKILPEDWQHVKVFVMSLESGVCVLRLEQIK